MQLRRSLEAFLVTFSLPTILGLPQIPRSDNMKPASGQRIAALKPGVLSKPRLRTGCKDGRSI
jgi:hypothetical protein